MNPLEIIVLVGVQASGKTTFFRRRLQDRCLQVSLDHWRGRGNVRRKEYQAVQAALGEAAENPRCRGVVIDNTNTTAATRRRYFDYAREFAAATGRAVKVVGFFFDEPLDACLERNALRPADAPRGEPYFVPPEAIRSFHARLEPPGYSEGFETIFRVRIVEGDFQVRELPHDT